MKKLAVCVSAFILSLIITVSAFANFAFSDVMSESWYYEAVQYAYDSGVMIGHNEYQFLPDTAITRAEVVTVIARLSSADLSECTETEFEDVEVDSWYGPGIVWAYDNNIVAGMNKTQFCPDTEITREQLCRMISDFLDYMGLATSNIEKEPFADEDEISGWALDAVVRLQKAGIVSGKSNNVFDPLGNATRAEVAQIIYSSKLADITSHTTEKTVPFLY